MLDIYFVTCFCCFIICLTILFSLTVIKLSKLLELWLHNHELAKFNKRLMAVEQVLYTNMSSYSSSTSSL